MDRLEPADGRAIEHPAFSGDVGVEGLDRDREVRDRARQVNEPDVNELHLLSIDKAEDFFSTAERHQPSLYRARISKFCWLSRLRAVWTVVVRNFELVSLMFHQCYTCSVAPLCPSLPAPLKAATDGRRRRADTVVLCLMFPRTHGGQAECGWLPRLIPTREILRRIFPARSSACH